MDCLEGLKLLPDNSIDAIVTDPPFGIGLRFKYNGNEDVANNPQDYWNWLKPIHAEMFRVLRSGGFLAIWQTHKYFKYFWEWFGEDIHIYAGCKNFVQLWKTEINNGFDPIVMKYKEGEPLRPKNPNRNVDYFVADTSQWVHKRNPILNDHPCPRPLDQVTEIVENFTLPKGIVLDPFMGSGTTALACMNTDRKFIGFEIDEDFCTLAEKRLQGLNGQEERWDDMGIFGAFTKRGTINL